MLRRVWVIAITAIIISALDAWSKWWAESTLELHQPQPLWEGVVRLFLTRNTGMAFSLGQGAGPLVILLPLAVVTVLLVLIGKRLRSGEHIPTVEQVGYGMIIGGALGNLGDRALHGMVTDFFQFQFIQFPVFNVADVMIDVGIGLLIIVSILIPAKKPADANE